MILNVRNIFFSRLYAHPETVSVPGWACFAPDLRLTSCMA